MTTPVIRWCDLHASEPQWRELEPAPAENRGFTERGEYAFEGPGAEWSFRIDDEPIAAGHAATPGSSWMPGFFAGEVTAELVGPTPHDHAVFLLDVAPDPSKVGREVFSAMLAELWQEAPELVVGSEPATTRIGDLDPLVNPWLAFARLRRYVPEFLRAIVPIQARPRKALRVRRADVPLHQARRIDRQTAATLVSSNAATLLLDDPGDAAANVSALRLDVPITEETVDSAANRAMLALLLGLIRRTTGLGESLQRQVESEQESETRTLLRARWPVRKAALSSMAIQLKSLLRRSPFAEVQRAEMTAAGLTAVAADPVYARAWNRGWRALRTGAQAGELSERMWISPSWEIYERWCFVRLGKVLRDAIPEWHWTRRTDRWVGAAAGRSAVLLLQPTFRSSDTPLPGPWSISRERIPDLVLRVDSADGTRFVVLDVKYRTSRVNVLDAMASAHVYQDSLRIGSRRPSATLLLIPAGGGAKWLEGIAFHSEHRVGVHVFSPGSNAAVPAIVTAALTG
jgi:hypothetical protein